ncbi:PREDICTED: probable proline--tRNA ligase, mitochondrial [Ceratosolen solmsi marchali]|uniref:Probable proline--tRNA ligase, mitochondrial n=1 Tax=Ceratosolen solmsi marchali TaxID=326594 RepID=A0AAJ6VNY9_9HYME|nr:PREDICTED: probable proline--tRNA ligase, mitochondrial [Ceratosolen solmsi marchali]
MKWINRVSKLFQPTNVVPKSYLPKIDVSSKSHQLMINTGIISNSSTGMFTFLPLGLKALEKLTKIIDEEMMLIGGQKIYLPALTSASLWRRTSRMVESQPELFMIMDRHGKEYLLSPTFEESITNVISSLGSLKRNKLPLKLYQISRKWRDEIKPRLGLLRSREFIMKDLYTFDSNLENATNTYNIVKSAYETILNRIGIPHLKIFADPGTIGGSISHEYHYLSNIGEDIIKLCKNCNYYEGRFKESKSYCPSCQQSLDKINSVEIGHTFLLGTKYSEPLQATFIDNNNKRQFLVMGSFGLGLSRILATAIEILSTDLEIRWPLKLAPYTVCIIPPKEGSKEESASSVAYDLYFELQNSNIDVIIDDRIKETIGKRFIEARKSGYPFVVVVGKNSLNSVPLIEVHDIYNSSQFKLELNEVLQYLKNIL